MRRYILLSLAVTAISGFASNAYGAANPKVGLSFSDFATERWARERDEMSKLLKDAGYEVLVQEANHDAKLQNDQIKNMVTQGAKVIIVDVGRNQAKGVLAVKNSGNFVLLGGSPTDNNAHLFRQGQMEVLNPLIKSGKIKVVADQWVENWDPANAKKLMENILTATGKKFDAVVASNDGTALGALEAMKTAGLAGKVPISGQDATEAGCNSIARGELTVTILKDTRKLTPLASELAVKLAKGEKNLGLSDFKLAELTGDNKKKGQVPCKFLKVFQVTKMNLKELVVDSGFQTYEGVYKDIPNPPAK